MLISAPGRVPVQMMRQCSAWLAALTLLAAPCSTQAAASESRGDGRPDAQGADTPYLFTLSGGTGRRSHHGHNQLAQAHPEGGTAVPDSPAHSDPTPLQVLNAL
jgi:hypothetical protein